ncbi:MAG: HAMP domain-containing protein [Deltaproteobacteria bacterium]|nr:HAMP domain-containing protein [Deltaproteobacteria bacterium]
MRRRIAFKLVVSVAVTLLAVLGLTAWLGLRALEDFAMTEVREGGDRLATTIKRSLRHAMLRDDREAVAQTVRAMADGEDRLDIRVFNKDGRVMFSSSPADSGRRVALEEAACRGCHQGGRATASLPPWDRSDVYVAASGERVFQRIEPIYNEPECATAPCHVHPAEQRVLGVMDVALPLARFDANMARFRGTAAVAAWIAVGLTAIVIVLLVSRLVTRRIRLMVRGTQRVSAGDLDHRIQAFGGDEIGVLATSFNEMTAKLQETRGCLLMSERLASLGRLSAGIAHEINNPLTGIALLADSTREALPDGDPRRPALETIVAETMRCREVIKGLLDFARQSPPSKQAVRMAVLVARAVAVLEPAAARRRVRLDPAGDGELEVVADPAQIQQVLLNLVLNAMDAMPDGGVVALHWSREGADAELSVTDTGVGIPGDALSKVFEPFFSTKGKKGTGLGLAVSWGIVEQHGGTIRVSSQVGVGSTFTVVLPAVVAAMGNGAGAGNGAGTGSGSGSGNAGG